MRAHRERHDHAEPEAAAPQREEELFVLELRGHHDAAVRGDDPGAQFNSFFFGTSFGMSFGTSFGMKIGMRVLSERFHFSTVGAILIQ